MIRFRLGALILCAATFTLASCGSDSPTGPGEDSAAFSMLGPWASTTVGSPARAYGITFSDSLVDNGWIAYSGMYAQTSNGQNGIILATARKLIGGPNVLMTFGGDQFHGEFTNANTIVGTMTIESVDYAITFERAF